MVRPKLLDLFCGAGGAAIGYYRAGFDVVGVDIAPQPNYPFDFIQGDALEIGAAIGWQFDAVHASPPCQSYSAMTNIHKNSNAHPDLVDPTREVLIKLGLPYVIENVKNAPLFSHLMLCGTMFHLPIIRHRYFELPWLPLVLMPPCNHKNVYDPYHGKRCSKTFKKAMGIDWMPDAGGGKRKGTVSEAIPPAYTEFIGKHLMTAVREATMAPS